MDAYHSMKNFMLNSNFKSFSLPTHFRKHSILKIPRYAWTKKRNSKVPLISVYYWDFHSKKPDRHLGYLWWKPRKTITSNTISGEVWITAPDFDLFAVQFDHRTVWCPHQFDLKRIIYQRVQTKSLLIREKSRSCKIGFWMLSEVSKS